MNVRQSVQLLGVNGAERGLDPVNIHSHSHSTEESSVMIQTGLDP